MRSQFNRQTSYVLLFAFTNMPVLLLFVAYIGKSQSPPLAPAVVAYGAALAVLIGAILMSGQIKETLEPQRFQTYLILSLSISEFASILSFVLVGLSNWQAFAPVVVGSVAVNLLFIAPRIAAYWRT